jgi:8-oxo-dGTP pyrophosphatase MutT (NUDIX family)
MRPFLVGYVRIRGYTGCHMEKVLSTHAVKAVIRNGQGDILLLQRDGSKRADGKSSWDFAGGLVEQDEDDKAALAREVKEEIGREATVGDVVGTWTFFRPHDGQTVHVTNYAVTLDNDDPESFTLSEEHIAAKYIARSAMEGFEVKDPSFFGALGE